MTSNEKLIRQAERFLGGAGKATLMGRLLAALKREEEAHGTEKGS